MSMIPLLSVSLHFFEIMPKYPKGILGVRKDPKNQILFSFNVREGDEWPSDDDEDDDYRPEYV